MIVLFKPEIGSAIYIALSVALKIFSLLLVTRAFRSI